MRDIRPSVLVRELRANIEIQQPTMLWGSGGVGKSSIVRQVADEMGMALLDVRLNLKEPVDFSGVPHVIGDTTHWAKPDFLPQEERDGKRGILFLDEVPNAPKATQAACYGLTLDRFIGNYTLPDGWSIVLAGNRMSDRGGTIEMPAPLKNRLAHYELEPNLDDWVVWAAKNDLEPMIIAFLRFRANLLFQFEPEHNAYPTPRTWAMLDKRFKNGISRADELYAVQSLVGEGAAGEFMTFKNTFESMPDLDEIIANPKKAEVPDDDPATMYAVAGALAAKATKKNFAAIAEYTGRIPPEFQVILIREAVTRKPELGETDTFNKWAADNANVIL